MHQMSVDVQEHGAIVLLTHQMGIPDLVVQSFASHRKAPIVSRYDHDIDD